MGQLIVAMVEFHNQLVSETTTATLEELKSIRQTVSVSFEQLFVQFLEDFQLYFGLLEGGSSTATKSNPALWHRIVERVKKENIGGTKSGQWSARKAQIAVKRYKDAGGR